MYQATVSFELLLALNIENFLAVIVTASLANAVISYILTALGALCHAGKNKLPIVRTSLVSASLRYFSLRYCHSYTSLKRVKHNFQFMFIFLFFVFVFVKEILENCEPRIYLLEHTAAIPLALRSAALGAESLAVFRAKKS